MARLVPVDQIELGMVLAAPLVNRYGQVLLAEGVEVQNKHIILMKTWGVKFISVASENDTQVVEVTDEAKKMAEKRLAARMKWEPQTDIETDLLKVAINRFAKLYTR